MDYSITSTSFLLSPIFCNCHQLFAYSIARAAILPVFIDYNREHGILFIGKKTTCAGSIFQSLAMITGEKILPKNRFSFEIITLSE